jgi:AraC-like DNA-binding protein
MLTAFMSGRGVYRNSVTELAVGPDMVGLVPPEDEGVLMSDPGDPYAHCYCRFGGAYAMALARGIIADRGRRFFHCTYAEAIADLVRRMGPIVREDLPDRMGEAELLLARSLVRLIQPPLDEPGARLSAASVEQYLRDHVAEPHDLERMAEHFAVSKTSLCRAVRRLCGRTVVEISEGMKVDWARTLLRLGGLNVTEVTLRVGYRDPFYFSRVFKRHVGASPKRWMLSEARGR